MKITESNDVSAIRNLRYAFSDSPFGEVLTACDEFGLCFAGFAVAGRSQALGELSRRFPAARLGQSAEAAVDIFGEVEALHLAGTRFRLRIWRELLAVKRGERISYSQLATRAGVPRAVRAAASAVASNPVSIVIPCHRVVPSDGSTGKYHWGAELKQMLLESEKKD